MQTKLLRIISMAFDDIDQDFSNTCEKMVKQ
jgi:hypothetical protein